MQKITPFIWFEDKADEAAEFYTSVFKNAKITDTMHMKNVPGPEGKVMTLSLELDGQEFTLFNGGPGVFKLSGAISFVINCETQEEVDYYWGKLSAQPEAEQCGWLVDKYGVSWQVVPTIMLQYLADPDETKAQRVTQAMMQMKKLDIPTLQKAYEG